ncbi:hypothetical protein [Phenylobacterium sp.]|uniref:hypothetical protein n=1 Tax=Phenylobacterium sp. TaxID=1871053 RepID=UPI002F3EDD8E
MAVGIGFLVHLGSMPPATLGLLTITAAVVTVALVRGFLARFGGDRYASPMPVAKDQSARSRSRFLLPGGILACVGSFLWMFSVSSVAPDTDLGVALIFFPALILMTLGLFAIVARIYFWMAR